MKLNEQIAQHFRQVHDGGNWTSVSLRETLTGVDWQAATIRVHGCNTIAALVFHINYYVAAQLDVLQGRPLLAKDQFSFDHPEITSPEDWQRLLQKTWQDADEYAALVAAQPDELLEQTFVDPRYGNWHRNLLGLIEHTHYHLGQIVLLKKIIKQNAGARFAGSGA